MKTEYLSIYGTIEAHEIAIENFQALVSVAWKLNDKNFKRHSLI